ncbi:DNA ligase D [Christiangramia forsetii]|uniref:DNA ligase (ATP) n=2 Tax=Christiangramia forsetii TaxID=411153 RepID=A0LY41_CHRFK|nr:DNA ligase D [Christiangramia forsetii]GGG35050.1 ATP-dependent DNA ligase [Christiangramia forsetii]CAL65286.1 ATP-dependent DNA ligase family protein [Christiangramia forsetii KT0803]
MSLGDYIRKRDFRNTPEPEAKISKANKQRFVVQRHQASRLHYDLRLEIDGVLKSWAVPKGPSMNPRDKRLAIHTEDHPIKYLEFHGTIPKGNYGAGEMKIWDSGIFESASSMDLLEQLSSGNLKIRFSGKKLKGEFALVRTNRGEERNQWLLIKKSDNYSTDLNYDAEDLIERSDPKPGKLIELNFKDPVKPMLATSTKEIFNDPDWIYELKWDGYRLIAHVNDGKVNLHSRNGISYNSKFPELVKDLKTISHEAILDGEVVVVDEDGLPSFEKLQNYDTKTEGALKFYVFDMLYLNGHSTLNLKLLERKSFIPEILEETQLAIFCDHIEGMGTAFYQKAISTGMEGVIAKKADSTYSPGYRTEQWLKVKAEESLETLICGYTDSEGALFGSLILGIIKDGTLSYIGNCGTGFSNKTQAELLRKMEEREIDTNPFEKKPNLKGRKANWVRPELVCEVTFSEWTKAGRMRHPVFKGLREDKSSGDLNNKSLPKEPKQERKSSSNSLEIDGKEVKFTNLDKIYWPESGLRKYDLIDYYLQVSEYILPYLRDRPQNLHRHPNGIHKKGFYQKDNEGLIEDWVETTRIYSKSTNRDIEYLLCQDEATLLYMANLGCIEINPWNSRIDHLDRPDYTVIDLDPSDKNSFDEVIEVALIAREILASAKINAYLKTSGSSGLHIYLPINAEYSYDEARDFTKLLCYFIQEKTSGLTSMDRAVKNRKDKIYLDYLQNRRGQTLASAYCVRPKEGAPVSAPLEWEELKKGLKITDFNIKNMLARLKEKGDLFQAVLHDKVDMEKALERLNKL